jgi:hypothetical protein
MSAKMLSPGTHFYRVALVTAAAIAIAVLSGCASTLRVDSAPPTTGAIDAAGDSKDDVPSVPAVKYDIDCATLISDEIATAALGAGDTAGRDVERGIITPLLYAEDQIGGFTCLWRNGEPEHGVDGQINPAHNSVQVHVIPDPDNRFARYSRAGWPNDTADAEFGEGSSTGCVSATGFCGTDVEIRGSWLEIRMIGLDLEPDAMDSDALARATPLIQSMVDRMPEPHAPDQTIGAVDCTVALPSGEALLRLGIPNGTSSHGYGGSGGYEQSEASADYAGAQWCSAGYSEGDGRWVKIEILPGGAWVFRQEEAEQSVAAGGAERVRIAGTSTPASYLACEVGPESRCSLDMAVGDDWVQVWLSKRDLDASTAEQDRAELLALAERVLQSLV